MIVMIVLSMLELRTGSPSFLRSPSNSVFSNCQALHSARSTPPSVTPVPGQPDDIPSRLIEPVDTFPQRQQMYGQSVSATMSLQLRHGAHAPLLCPSFAIHPTTTGSPLHSCSREEDLRPSTAYQSIVIPSTTLSPSPHEDLPGHHSDIEIQKPIHVPQETTKADLSPCQTDLVERESTGDLSLSQQMTRKSRIAAIVVLSSLIAYVSINSLVKALNPSLFIWYEEDKDESRWLASSHSWFDRKACRWLSLCGLAHLRLVRPIFGHRKAGTQDPSDDEKAPWHSAWGPAANVSRKWPDEERALRQIPDYVLEYAPLVHLYSQEQFWPGDIAEHLYHTTPTLNYTPIQSPWEHPTLRDLDQLNQFQEGQHVFLTSNDDVEGRPSWLEGEKNIPDPGDMKSEESWTDWDGTVGGTISGDTEENRVEWYDSGDKDTLQGETGGSVLDTPEGEELLDELRKRYGGKRIRAEGRKGGRSDAPAILIVVDKGNGIVDAFWFYFYSFNLGNVVLNIRFGNHVGDWEHCLVRFHNGKPKALFFSAHSAGEAYSYDSVEKIGKRPVIYSAVGTHAMYATPGIHEYILPWGLLHDQTDRGPLWDPVLNSHTYTYDYLNDTLRASVLNPDSPTGWFHFNGHWGDKFYPLGDTRQYRFAGQYHYVNGPLGPKFKNLHRRKVCQGSIDDPCVIRNWIDGKSRPKRWVTSGTGE